MVAVPSLVVAQALPCSIAGTVARAPCSIAGVAAVAHVATYRRPQWRGMDRPGFPPAGPAGPAQPGPARPTVAAWTVPAQPDRPSPARAECKGLR